MTRTILATSGAFALGCVLTVAAQTPAPQRPPASPAQKTPAANADPKVVTVTGCLKVWDDSMGAAPSGTARYVLTNVEPGAASSNPSDPAAPRLSAQPTQYAVTADAAVNLAPHVNHKVQLTGTTSTALEHAVTNNERPMDSGRPGDPARTSVARPGDPMPQTAIGSPSISSSWGAFNATALTMVAPTCTPAP